MKQLAKTVPLNEEFLRRVVASSPDCILVLDLQGNLLGMNEGGQSVLEIADLGSRLGTCWIGWWKGRAQEQARQAVQEAMQGGTGHFEAAAETFGGSPRWWDVTVSPILAADGHPEQILSVMRDATRHRLAEEAAKELSELRRLALDSARMGTWHFDLLTGRIRWDDQFKSVFGVHDGELTYERLLALLHLDDREQVRAAITAASRPVDPVPYAIEYRVAQPDGSWRWVEAHGKTYFEGEGETRCAVKLVGTVRDITGARSAQEALRESETRFRSFVAATSDTVYTMSADWGEMRNLEGKRFLADTQHPSRTWLETYIPPEDRAQVLAAIQAAIRQKRPFELEHRVVRADGTVGWTFSRAIPLLDTQGSITEWIGAASDVTERRRASEAVRESEERLHAMAQHLPGGAVFIVDRDLRYRLAEGEALRDAGLASEDLVGKTIFEALPPEIAADHEPRLRRALAGEPFTQEHSTRGRDFVSRGAALRGADGGVYGVLVVSYDITERKQADWALRSSEQKYRTLFESLDEGFCVVEVLFDDAGRASDYRFLETNPSFERQAGLHGAPGKRIRELVAEHEEYWFETYGRVARTGQPERFENRAAALGRWFSGYAWRYGAPENRQVAILLRDETERQGGTERVRASEERYRLIFESAQANAIFTMDAQGLVTSWNPGAVATFGWTPAEIVGQDVYRLLPPEQKEIASLQPQCEEAAREGRCECEEWFVRRDGSRFWGSGSLSPLRKDGGQESVGFLKIMRDRTDELQTREARDYMERQRTRLLEAEQKARRAAEEANAAKDHFLAVLSHELRTPLTPVTMALAVLRRNRNLPEAVRETHEMIRRNVDLEARLIDDLLDVTRITRGKMEIVCKDMDLHETVRRAVEVSTPDLEAKEQPFTVALEAEDCRLCGDSTRLQQVFWNLLKNASKFTPEGGAVSVRSRNEPGRVVVEVTDTGIGLAAEAVERVFNPFEQASVEITREFGGLGLGLAIAKATVEAHGGTLRASSLGPGQGATFTVRLPLAAPGE